MISWRRIFTWGMRAARHIISSGGLVLLYHRVAKLDPDPQLLAVSPAHFAQHLEILTRRFHAVSLSEMMDRVWHGRSLRGLVALTFDDGYADNLYNAKPLLERYGVPATVFVTVNPVKEGRHFWWDELEDLLLGGETEKMALAYRKFYGRIRHLHPVRRQIALSRIRKVLNEKRNGKESPFTCPRHRSLVVEELLRLVKGGLIEVGAHTLNHPVLARLSPAEQEEEIIRSKAELEDILGRKVEGFSYPYGGAGDYTSVTVEIVRRAGFAWACANRPGRVTKRTDPFQIPRFLVRDWNGGEFERRLKTFV